MDGDGDKNSDDEHHEDEHAAEPDQAFAYSAEKTLINQGAEARVYRCRYLGKEAVLKERFSKKYRHEELDRRLTKDRIRNEFRSITRCKQLGIDVPSIYFLNTETNGIIFEYINGPMAKDFIEDLRKTLDEASFKEKLRVLGKSIGKTIGRLHSFQITHGDLTTSNLILRDADPERVCLIDFGLSAGRSNCEDFGVDLYVLERAIRTTHIDGDSLMDEILAGYESTEWKGAKASVKKLAEVRLRGRKREMIG